MPFVKLDCGILDSSLWLEPPETRVVFLTMLAMTEPSGLCPATAPGISRRANLPLPVIEKALITLEAPDPHSRSLEAEGRRIERVDGGYHMVNYLRYRAWSYSDSPEAVRKRKYRKKGKDIPDKDGTCPGHGGTCPDVSASTSTSKSKGKGSGEGADEAFETWWKRYPGSSAEKGSKSKALEKWNLTLKRGTTVETLDACLTNYLDAQSVLDYRRAMNATRFLGPAREWEAYVPGTYQKPASVGINGKPIQATDPSVPLSAAGDELRKRNEAEKRRLKEELERSVYANWAGTNLKTDADRKRFSFEWWLNGRFEDFLEKTLKRGGKETKP